MSANQEEINQMTEWLFSKYIDLMSDRKTSNIHHCGELKYIELEIPIDSIDGVRLEHMIVKMYRQSIQLIIVIRKCEYSDNISWFCPNKFMYPLGDDFKFCKDVCFTKDTIRKAMESIFNSIENLKYNNYEGHFTEEKVLPLPFKALAKMASLGKAKPGKGASECCVCYEHTKTHFSKCNHVVCGRCITNMNGHLKCPMCRVKISTEAQEDEDEDEEEEEE